MSGAPPSPLAELVCGVCLADLLTDAGGKELGELDCCNHRWGGEGKGAAGGNRRPPAAVAFPLSLPRVPPCLPPRHRFCFPCISKWSQIENSCPFCKQRFQQLRRKQLAPRRALLGVDTAGELPGTYLDCQPVEERNQVCVRLCVSVLKADGAGQGLAVGGTTVHASALLLFSSTGSLTGLCGCVLQTCLPAFACPAASGI